MEPKNDELNKEGTQEELKTEVTEVKKGGFGTAIKVGGMLLIGAAFTGLGWILKGILGGKDNEDEGETAETTAEE